MSSQESELRAFFADPTNYAHKPIEDVVRSLGPATYNDDWDWGRYIYGWEQPNLRFIVVTRGGYVTAAEELDPHDTTRFGTTLRVLWGNSSP